MKFFLSTQRSNFSYQGVLDFCEDMQAVAGQPLDSLARWFRYVYGDAECFDPSYNTLLERYSNPEWDQVGTNNGSKLIFSKIRIRTYKKNYTSRTSVVFPSVYPDRLILSS